MPSATIIVRLYNEAANVYKVLDMAVEQTHAPTHVRVLVDQGSTDGTLEEVQRFCKTYIPTSPNTVTWTLHAHCTLWDATKLALSETSESRIFLLDADNKMPLDRVERQLESENAHACDACLMSGYVNVMTQDGQQITRHPNGPLDFAHLMQGNRLDGLNLMLDGEWVRRRVVGAMQRADDLVPGEKVDDYFIVLMAARENGICHHDIHVGDYIDRPTSLSHRRSPVAPTERTQLAITKLIQEGII